MQQTSLLLRLLPVKLDSMKTMLHSQSKRLRLSVDSRKSRMCRTSWSILSPHPSGSATTLKRESFASYSVAFPRNSHRAEEVDLEEKSMSCFVATLRPLNPSCSNTCTRLRQEVFTPQERVVQLWVSPFTSPRTPRLVNLSSKVVPSFCPIVVSAASMSLTRWTTTLA